MQISNYLKKDGRGQQELTPDLNTIKQDNNMSLLQNIKRGVQQRPQRVIIYGPEGVGKSTLAAGLPAPVLLDTEQGSSHIDVARLPELRRRDQCDRRIDAGRARIPDGHH